LTGGGSVAPNIQHPTTLPDINRVSFIKVLGVTVSDSLFILSFIYCYTKVTTHKTHNEMI